MRDRHFVWLKCMITIGMISHSWKSRARFLDFTYMWKYGRNPWFHRLTQSVMHHAPQPHSHGTISQVARMTSSGAAPEHHIPRLIPCGADAFAVQFYVKQNSHLSNRRSLCLTKELVAKYNSYILIVCQTKNTLTNRVSLCQTEYLFDKWSESLSNKKSVRQR